MTTSKEQIIEAMAKAGNAAACAKDQCVETWDEMDDTQIAFALHVHAAAYAVAAPLIAAEARKGALREVQTIAEGRGWPPQRDFPSEYASGGRDMAEHIATLITRLDDQPQ